MNLAILGFAIYLGLRLGDRMRLINWHTVLPLHVAMYLTSTLYVLCVLASAYEGAATWEQAIGLAPLFCLLEVTKHNWMNGVPETAKTAPAELGHSELEHYP